MTGRSTPPGPAPTGPDDRLELDALAGEFVLGSLSERERRDADLRLETDPDFARLVADWRRRLAPLDDSVPPVAPPADLFARIEAQIAGQIERQNETASAPVLAAASMSPASDLLLRRLNRWRAAALAAAATSTALAASLAALLLAPLPETEPVVAGQKYLAVVNRDGAQPAIVVSVDIETGIVSLRDLGAEQPADRSLEVWYLAGDGSRPPLSLGVLADSADITHLPVRDADYGRTDAAIAITLEPKGGSPNGDPTGPVVYSGKLIPEPR
ncbi:anti-sigma factor [Pannonibacter carbonis]|uniref:anti-sigma factor n=1 Tax=Pannonibacter carbonis TaxID=2067569 RepID=UPI0013003E01|nr:anti-sigma factor [Pannonibacter carbonis]